MKKLTVIAAAFGLSLAVLTGCGTPSATDLLKTADEYEMESATMLASIDFAIEVEGDEDGKLSLQADVDAQMSGIGEKNSLSYAEVSYDINVDGDKEKGKLCGYLETKKDDLTVYFQIPDADEWYKLALDADTLSSLSDAAGVDVDSASPEIDEEVLESISDAVYAVMENATVEKSTVDIEGTDCYAIVYDGTLSDFQEVYEIMFDEVDGMSDILDAADISEKDFYKALECMPVNMTFYVAKDEGYLAGADIDLTEIDMMGMFDVLGVDPEDEGIEEINVDSFFFSLTYTDVNETEVELSDDAEDAMDMSSMLGMLGGMTVDPEPIDPAPVTPDPVDPDPYEPQPTSYGWADIYDYYGEYFITAWEAYGYEYTPEEDAVDGANYKWFTFCDGVDYIYVNTWAGEVSGPLDSALKGYDYEDEYPEYEDYTFSMEPMDQTINGNDCYFVTESYTLDGYDYEWSYVVSEYTDSEGYDEWFTVEFTDTSIDADYAEDIIYEMFVY